MTLVTGRIAALQSLISGKLFSRGVIGVELLMNDQIESVVMIVKKFDVV